ncbi:MurR/RpiR family transcriptional regulator [Sedimentibacter sp.]|uniref:MurR/RpiR family transcriptional regulator n=1 Tax=Sedimentibacter sp. TaxID=1960295 RepID=UPI0028ABE5F8|nr:MurR/RpiR family transcriptional regulator [Sedimentibacter sp.]
MDFINLVKDKFESLSKSHKKIAKYIIDNFEQVIFDTASELSKKVSVSEVTVIRFAYALGFESFSHMRKAMEKSVVDNAESLDVSIGKGLFMNGLSDMEMDEHIRKQTLQLGKSYQNIDYEEFKKICEVLMSKKRILIIGFMDSFGTASELLHLLDGIRSRVYFSKLMYENAYTFEDIDEDSATIVVSFTPHYKYTKEQAEIVKRNKSTIITITDSFINPFKDLSDHSLIFNLRRNEQLGVIDTSPVISFIFFMMNYLYENYKGEIDEFKKNKIRYEEYID